MTEHRTLTGQFQLRLRAPAGARIERTEEVPVKTLDLIKDKVSAENVSITVGYVGTIPSSFPINAVYQCERPRGRDSARQVQ